MDFNSFFSLVSEELNNKNQIVEKEMLKKIGSAIASGWEKLKNKIKEVWAAGFRFGYAVGKTFQNKFVLFNKLGKIITPPADKISYESADKGKKVLTLYYRNDKFKSPLKVKVSDTLDFGFASGVTKNNIGVMYVIKPNKGGVNEWLNPKEMSVLLEQNGDDDEDVEKELEKSAELMAASTDVFMSFTGPGGERLRTSEEKPPKIKPSYVDYTDFKRELSILMDSVKDDEVIEGSKMKVLGIYAPTGWGKSEIIKSIAEEKGFNYFPIELKKVDLNIIQGFPYLEDYEEEPGKKKKRVRAAPSVYFPPSGDKGNWLLFFDEFNRADTEKMSAVMNLLLTGELGGLSEFSKKKTGEGEVERYKLPEKTVVLLAMNTGTQQGVEDSFNAVNNLDIATLERVHRVVFGKYNLTSWLKNFANKPFRFKLKSGFETYLPWRIPPIIKNFLVEVYKKELESSSKKDIDPEEAPFLFKIKVASKEGAEGGGGERTTSPRSWTLIADRMFEEGWQLYKRLPQEEKEKYKKEGDKMVEVLKNKGVDNIPDSFDSIAFIGYMNDAKTQIHLMSKQAPEFGEEGDSFVRKIINSFLEVGKIGINEELLLFNYKSIRKAFIESRETYNKMFGAKSKIFTKFFILLNKFKSESELERFMKSKGYPIIDKNGVASQMVKTIIDIYKQLDGQPDDLFTFVYLIEQNSNKNNLLKEISLTFKTKWEDYEKCIKSKSKTRTQVYDELRNAAEGEDISDINIPNKGEKNEDYSQINDELKKLLEVLG